MPQRFLRKLVTAERVGWHPEHMMTVATDPEYAHLNFPKPVRTGKNSVVFVEAEIDAWMEARIAERDEHGFKPKDVNPRKNNRRAKEREGDIDPEHLVDDAVEALNESASAE